MMSVRNGCKLKYLFLILSLFYNQRGIHSAADDEVENLKKLRQDVLKNYDKASRPVLHHTNVTIVEMTLDPFYISELNEEKCILVMDSWTRLVWNDDHLTWNPANYKGVNYLPLGSTEVWKPDISVFNSCPASEIDPFGQTNLAVTSDGTVKWTPPATTRTQCFLDYTDYPWDRQNCSIIVGSWSQHGLEINLTISKQTVDLKDFRDTNPYWKMEKITVNRKIEVFECCPEPYINVEYYVELSRRPTIAQQLEWITSIGIVILTLAVFWLPPNSDAKLTLGSINIITSTGLLMYLEAHIKSAAALPYIARLLNFSLYTVTSAMILEILVMNMASTFGPCAPPQQLYNIVSGMVGRILLVNVNDIPTESTTAKPSVRKQWLTIATMTDRILFSIFLIVLLAIPKTG